MNDYLKRIKEVRDKPSKRTAEEAYHQMDKMMNRNQKGSSMKVKVGNTIYDSNDEPVMVILSDVDKKNISQMYDECSKYCGYPEGIPESDIEEFMKTDESKND